MSQEITLNAMLDVNNPNTGGGFHSNFSVTKQFTQNGLGQHAEIPAIPTTQTALALTNVATPGWAWFQNLDTTNYVQVGIVVSATFYPVLRLEAGEVAILRLDPAVSLYAKADTAPVDLWYSVMED